MRHHIIVKYTDQVTDKPALDREITALFAQAAEIPGVHGADVCSNVIDRANRYDLMIVVRMERDALPAWDASDLHHRWKAQYGHLVAAKTIFDCE